MKLPESWREVRLGDILHRVEAKVDPQRAIALTHFYVGLEHIESHTGRLLREAEDVTNSTDILSIKTAFQKGDLLYGKLRPNLNKVHLADQDGICSTDIWALRAIDELNPEFGLHFLRSPAIHVRASQLATGANLPRVSAESFDRISFPLPTLPEQQRIVDVLKQAESVEKLRDEAKSIMEQLAKQRFAEMFGHPAENAKGFETSLFQDFGTLDRGISKHRPRDASHLFGGRYPFIQTGDVSNAGDWITTYKSTYSEAGLAQSRLWPKGTLCITIAANIAKAAILEFDACFPDSVVGFTPNDDVCSEYVLYCLRFYQEYFEHRAPKSAQMNINLDTLRTLRMPKPPKALQQQFVAVSQEIRGMKNMLFKQIEDHSTLVGELRVAAFTGELTEAWRAEHQNDIRQATTERKVSLRVSVKGAVVLPSQPKADESIERRAQGTSRHALLSQLSELQGFVRLAIIEQKTLLLADNSAEFDEFCRMWPLEHLSGDRDRIRRALDQLATFGLIAKVSLRNSQGLFVNAYRCFAEGEDRRVNDVIELRKQLLRLTDLETGQEELN